MSVARSRRRALVLTASFLALAAGSVLAQPRGGILRVRLLNGTTGGAGRAEHVTLYRLRNEMIPVEELDSVEGSFEITDVEVEGERPMLLQVTSSGVNYNEPIRFGRGYEAQAEITVYDVFSEWDDDVLEIETSRFLVRRMEDALQVDKIFVVSNRSDPPKTFHDPEGTFRFFLPTTGLRQLLSVSAIASSGMPVPQQASPLPDGSGYVTKTAFKPGSTDIAISYEVGYEDESYELVGRAYHPLSELLVLLAPPDIRADASADGWESLGPEPQGRFAVVRKTDLAPGDSYRLRLSGGSERAAELVPPSSGGGGESGAAASSPPASGAPSGPVTRIPDGTRSSKWLVVVFMAAALAYGLLTTLFPSTRRR